MTPRSFGCYRGRRLPSSFLLAIPSPSVPFSVSHQSPKLFTRLPHDFQIVHIVFVVEVQLSCPALLSTRLLNNHCTANLGCKRHRAPGYTACRLHTNRKHRNGTYHAVLRLTQSRAHPYIGAAFSWLREAVRLHDPQVMLSLTEFDAFLRQCPLVYLHDLGNKRLDARRKAKGILANVLKRFPDGYQAASAVLSVAWPWSWPVASNRA